MTDKKILDQVMRDQVQPVNAIKSLVPGSAFKLEKDGKTFVYFRNKAGLTQPTESEIDTEVIRLQVEYDAQEYARDRQYPTWQEQMDMQYHDEIDGTTTWKDAVAKVKADNPK